LPVYRQVNRAFQGMKLDIAESSVCRWRDQIAEPLTDQRGLMKSEIKLSYCINTDASPAPIRFPDEKNRIVKGNMYVYIGGKDRPYNVFDVHPNQSAKPIHEFLKGDSNNVQCDAHGNDNALFDPKIPDPNHLSPKEVGCHAHCRRNFVEAEGNEPNWVKRFLTLYKKLYKIEAETKNESVAGRYHRRQRESVPLLDALFDLGRECQNNASILPKSPLGKACAYAMNNENALRRYCDDGRLAIDNNFSERTLKEFVIGRKNWMFLGSLDVPGQPRSRQILGHHHEHPFECPATRPQRMGIPGGRVVQAERLELEDRRTGKSPHRPLGEITSPTNRRR